MDLGWTDGRNLRMDLRWGGGDADRIPAVVKELVGLQPNTATIAREVVPLGRATADHENANHISDRNCVARAQRATPRSGSVVCSRQMGQSSNSGTDPSNSMIM
jgi:hypothetical protein